MRTNNSWWMVAAAVVALGGVGAANATVLFSDSFSYPDGNITNVAAGVWNHVSGFQPLVVDSGAAVVTHGSGSRQDVTRSFGSPITSGSVYAAFEMTASALAPIGGGDYEYFAHFGIGTSSFRSRMDLVAPTGGGDFRVGIATGSSTAETIWGSDLSFGQTYQVVLQYDRDIDQARLWVNPADEFSTSIAGDVDSNVVDVAGFYLRQSNSSTDESIRVDNLQVATTFAEAIPEPGSLVLLGLGGLSAMLRRRR